MALKSSKFAGKTTEELLFGDNAKPSNSSSKFAGKSTEEILFGTPEPEEKPIERKESSDTLGYIGKGIKNFAKGVIQGESRYASSVPEELYQGSDKEVLIKALGESKKRAIDNPNISTSYKLGTELSDLLSGVYEVTGMGMSKTGKQPTTISQDAKKVADIIKYKNVSKSVPLNSVERQVAFDALSRGTANYNNIGDMIPKLKGLSQEEIIKVLKKQDIQVKVPRFGKATPEPQKPMSAGLLRSPMPTPVEPVLPKALPPRRFESRAIGEPSGKEVFDANAPINTGQKQLTDGGGRVFYQPAVPEVPKALPTKQQFSKMTPANKAKVLADVLGKIRTNAQIQPINTEGLERPTVIDLSKEQPTPTESLPIEPTPSVIDNNQPVKTEQPSISINVRKPKAKPIYNVDILHDKQDWKSLVKAYGGIKTSSIVEKVGTPEWNREYKKKLFGTYKKDGLTSDEIAQEINGRFGTNYTGDDVIDNMISLKRGQTTQEKVDDAKYFEEQEQNSEAYHDLKNALELQKTEGGIFDNATEYSRATKFVEQYERDNGILQGESKGTPTENGLFKPAEPGQFEAEQSKAIADNASKQGLIDKQNTEIAKRTNSQVGESSLALEGTPLFEGTKAVPQQPLFDKSKTDAFQVDDKLTLKSPHTDKIMQVSYRGIGSNGKSVIWTGTTQMEVPNQWLSKPSTGQEGFIDVDIFAKPAESLAKSIEKFVFNYVDKTLSITKRFGEQTFAEVIKAIHMSEAEMVAFDAKFDWLEKRFDKYSDKDIDNFNMTRGNAQTEKGQEIQLQALRDVKPELKGAYSALKKASDYAYELAIKIGDVNYLDDYFYGSYTGKGTAVDRFLEHWKTSDRWTKEKKLPTPADAKAFGLELKQKNPVRNIKEELRSIANRIGMKELQNFFKGKPFEIEVSKASKEQLESWLPIQDPLFNGKLYDPFVANFVNDMISTNKTSKGFLAGIRNITYATQQVKFLGSMFHAYNMIKHQTALHSGGIVNPKWIGEISRSFKSIDKNDPLYKEYISLGGGHRYSLEAKASNGIAKLVEDFSGAVGLKDLYKKTKFLPPSPEFIKWMFDEWIPTLKFNAWKQEVLLQEKLNGKVLTDYQKIQIVKRVQNLFGEMNERLFGRSSTVTSALRLIFMAPGYGEGNMRTIIEAFSEGGFDPRKKRQAQFIINSLVTSLVMASVFTYVMTGKPPDKPKSPDDVRDLFKAKTGVKDKNGDDVYFDMMTYDNDYWNIGLRALIGKWNEIPGELSKRVANMKSTTASIGIDLANIFQGKLVYDYMGNRVFNQSDSFVEKLYKLTKYELSLSQPISFSTLQQEQKKNTADIFAIPRMLIGLRPVTSENVKKIKEGKREISDMTKSVINKQYELNNLFVDNRDEARKEARKFNEEQLKEFEKITGRRMPIWQQRRLLITRFRKNPASGTSFNNNIYRKRALYNR
jgi:hypothetical protein